MNEVKFKIGNNVLITGPSKDNQTHRVGQVGKVLTVFSSSCLVTFTEGERTMMGHYPNTSVKAA